MSKGTSPPARSSDKNACGSFLCDEKWECTCTLLINIDEGLVTLGCLTDVEGLVNTGEFWSMQCSIASHATSSVVLGSRFVTKCDLPCVDGDRRCVALLAR